MNHTYANNVYKNNQVMTAPKKKLLLMLYDGAIKNLKQAELSITNKEIEKVNTNLTKAQDIIAELMSTLNFEVGGDIAKNLHQLYDYMYVKLIRANIDKDIDAVVEVKKFMEELRDTWAQL
ncbi:flagellar export chaperone FliS [Alkalibaculum sp. M08DMB]|uniref:Flagellar export chaperone FliS n=1 Tax=Alkalibaculum sporogenes TaxID=2655001 RepID=A0A6A7K5S1_9FIRM|nr:flagellar export chaperone FliS [Alkalibaculum sporogenes]MPW24786.1 flagellar export chaperone FliS [Alkalibaculum sporogenes]